MFSADCFVRFFGPDKFLLSGITYSFCERTRGLPVSARHTQGRQFSHGVGHRNQPQQLPKYVLLVISIETCQNNMLA